MDPSTMAELDSEMISVSESGELRGRQVDIMTNSAAVASLIARDIPDAAI